MMAWMLINETKFKKNIVIGATLPKEAREDTKVQKICSDFRKQQILTAAVLTLIALAAVLLPWEHTWTAFMIWTLAAVCMPYIPYIFSHEKMMRLKEDRGWIQQSRVIRVSTSSLPPAERLNPLLFVICTILSLAPVFFDREMWPVYVCFAAMCPFFWFSCRYLYRHKAEMVDENMELTKALSAVRTYHWSKLWAISTICCPLYSLCCLISSHYALIGILLVLAVTAVLCVFAFRMEMKLRSIQEKLTKDSGSDWYADEDDRWIFGFLYYNPDDTRTIINSRVGMNSTVNMATVPGKVIMVITALLFVSLPFLGIMLDGVSRQEIVLANTEEAVKADAGWTHYTIDQDDIVSVTLMEKLPDNFRRRVGTGLENLCKGSFVSDETGRVTVLLDPTVSPFLLIETDEGKKYLLGSRDPALTEKIYNDLSD